MFIYSFKASTLKFLGVICVSIVALLAMVLLIPTNKINTTEEIAAMNENISFNNVKNVSDGANFLLQYGWEVEKTPVEECEITIPASFDKIMTQYNEIQKQQGLDLTKYQKKTVTRYTYKVTNYPGYDETVYANVITFRGKVIGGDICTADSKGFLHTFSMPKNVE